MSPEARTTRAYVVDYEPDPWQDTGGWRLYAGPRVPRGGRVKSCTRFWTQADACNEAVRRIAREEAFEQGFGITAVGQRITLLQGSLRLPFHSWHQVASFLEARRRADRHIDGAA